MKKLFLSLIAVAVGALSSFAQDDLVATLTHGSTLTTYTGADALSDAYTDAADGDVITLSPGVFNAVDIRKAITIRGAGMIPMESNGYVSTQLSGDFTIYVKDNASTIVTIEAIHVLGYLWVKGNNLAPANLQKSRFQSGVVGNGISMTAFSCVFLNGLCADYETGEGVKNVTLNCMNCVINQAQADGYYAYYDVTAMAKIIATNCVLRQGSYNLPYCVLTNSIIYTYNSWDVLPETCAANNCVAISNSEYFINIKTTTNVTLEDNEETYKSLFKTLTRWNDITALYETFQLTNTAAATYLGGDGKQVGLYGGTSPYDITPTNPQVTNFTVGSSTSNGKLTIKINVE